MAVKDRELERHERSTAKQSSAHLYSAPDDDVVVGDDESDAVHDEDRDDYNYHVDGDDGDGKDGKDVMLVTTNFMTMMMMTMIMLMMRKMRKIHCDDDVGGDEDADVDDDYDGDTHDAAAADDVLALAHGLALTSNQRSPTGYMLLCTRYTVSLL